MLNNIIIVKNDFNNFDIFIFYIFIIFDVKNKTSNN